MMRSYFTPFSTRMKICVNLFALFSACILFEALACIVATQKVTWTLIAAAAERYLHQVREIVFPFAWPYIPAKHTPHTCNMPATQSMQPRRGVHATEQRHRKFIRRLQLSHRANALFQFKSCQER